METYKDWPVVCQDESIFIYDIVLREVWAIKGSKPQVPTTGSHQKTCIFGTLALDGRQLFRQYSKINQYTFLDYMICLKRKFKKFVFFYDGAPWHRAKMIREFFKENEDCIIPIRFPRCSPEYNVVEECWRQGKKDILGSILPPSFDAMKKSITSYYRTKRFNLNMVKYLCH